MKNEQNLGASITRRILGWESASDQARKWWGELEKMNSGREDLVLKLMSELLSREGSIEDFYLACSYSGREGVTENLKFLDSIKQDKLPNKSMTSSNNIIKNRVLH